MGMQKKSLGDILVDSGVISQDQLNTAYETQKSAPGEIGNIIMDLGFASEREIASAQATSLGLQFVDLTRHPIDPEAIKAVQGHIVKRYNVLPIKRDGNRLMVAVSNLKASTAGLEDIRLVSRCTIYPVLAAKGDLEDAIKRAYGENGKAGTGPVGNGLSGLPAIDPSASKLGVKANGLSGAPALISEGGGSAAPAVIDQGVSALAQAITMDLGNLAGGAVDEDEADLADEAGEAPIIRIAHAIIQQAVREKASDIHVEPGGKGVRIRYRIDGVLNETMVIPKHIQNQLIARFKIMAELNIAERRVPQDGRIGIKHEGKDYDLRVSCLPTYHGEKIVMRILDKSSVLLGLEKLGFEPEVQAKLEELVSQPNGMVLTTGPTGSGKTTTLYSVLNKINSVERNIITIEDPVEYQLPGVSQVQVNRKAGLTFAAGLRSFLRQDPDVIMVGEMRDLETAQIAVEASLTGHLVLSTLHTNDAPSAVMRMADMGIETYLIAATVIGIMAQRLCRKICTNCKVPVQVPAQELVKFGMDVSAEGEILTLYRGNGCEECRGKGYKGRIGLYELMVMNEELADLVVRRAPVADIREVAKASGMKELRQDGLVKVLEGLTTPEEVRRVVFTAGF